MNMVDKRCSCCGGENPEKVRLMLFWLDIRVKKDL